MQRLMSVGVWSQIRALSAQSRTRTAAIAYVTSEAIAFGSGDILITDASDTAIACGETSAKVLEVAISNGAAVYSCDGLHAKVIAFDRIAVIGSANLSDRSERRLVEAAWITDDPVVLEEVSSFVRRLAEQSRRIDPALLRRLLSIKVARRLPLLSKRSESLNLDDFRGDAAGDGARLPIDQQQGAAAPSDASAGGPSSPHPSEIADVLSRNRHRSDDSWVLDPRLVLMDREEVIGLSNRRRRRTAEDAIQTKVWARKSDLGTGRETPRTVPRPDFQLLIGALIDLAKVKRSAPTTQEILDLVVARYESGRYSAYYDTKTSDELREDPRGFYGEYFRNGTEDSGWDGGKLKYFLRATPERTSALLTRLGVGTKRRGQEKNEEAD